MRRSVIEGAAHDFIFGLALGSSSRRIFSRPSVGRESCDVRRETWWIDHRSADEDGSRAGLRRQPGTVYAYLRGEAETELEQVLSTLPADERPLASLEDYDALLPFRAAEPVPAERI